MIRIQQIETDFKKFLGVAIKTLLLIVLLSIFASCLRLDDNLYNESKISEYKLDNYSADDVDFYLDGNYKIADSLVKVFTLQSRAANEDETTTIYAIYIGSISKIATDTVIMYCHGNKDHMDFYWQRAKLLANTGGKNRFGVMMIDYRGFGMSEGNPTENGMYADVDAALQWLKQYGLTDNRLVMYGFSLGSAPATKLTANTYSLVPAKLLLEAPFASAEVMEQDASGLALPGSVVTDLKINNGEEIKKVHQPFFWIHGEADDFLNIETHGEVVFNNYNGTYKEAHRIANAGHSNIEPTMGFENYMEAVEKFVSGF